MDSRRIKILIAEDSAIQAEKLRRLLAADGYSVLVSRDGAEGLSKARESKPDLVISDIMMPEMDGFELCRHIKSDPDIISTPVILLTSLTDPADVISGLECGADNFIVKPYDDQQLLTRVKQHLLNLELHSDAQSEKGVEILFSGKKFFITSDKKQILGLLISTYENAVQKNRELTEAQERLNSLNQTLQEKVWELAASEDRFRTLVLTVPDIVYRIDFDGKFVFVNNAVRQLGYEPDELIGEHFSRIMLLEEFLRTGRDNVLPTSADKTTSDQESPKLFDERRTGSRMTTGLEVRLLSKNRDHNIPSVIERLGEEVVVVEINSSGIYEFDTYGEKLVPVGTVGIIRDISERKLAEEELKKAYENVSQKNVELQKAQNELKDLNKRLEDMVGERTAELADANRQLQLELGERKLAEETLRESEEKYRNLFNNAEVGIYRTRLDGSETLDVNQKYLDIVGKSREETIGKPSAINWADPEERDEMVRRLLADGRVSGFEYKKLNRHTGVRNCLTSVVLYREEGILEGSILDITKRKRAEEEKAKLEDQLQQSQKMESIGRLAGGVAHDFNNMLGVIIGRSELALMKSEPSEHVYANLIEIRSAAERSAALTRQLLAFARKQTIAPKVINLNETLTGMLKMLQRLIGEGINLNLQPASNLWPVRVDPAQVDQILANLCVNARDAIDGVGRIAIETGNCSVDAHYCAAHTHVEPGKYVRLAVSDDGSGMDRETLAHIFEPFFTTKGVGEGTGLGLATVYGIVRQNNGFINVYSEPGQGTTFTICLPRHAGESGESLDESLPEPLPRGNETLLLVEDEPGILETTALMLEGQGYSVLRAGNAAEAIRLFREQTGTVHMLITDVVMPEMNGRDLAGELLSAHPQLNCLFMSGYTSDVIAQHGVLEEGVHFIQKPFSLFDLSTKVREVLDSK